MRLIYAVFALTLLVSSSLLFAIQPIVAKLIQPILGGSPAVWNTSMVFFQGTLLLGYLYAHLSIKWLGVRRQALLHLVLLACGLFFLPVAFAAPEDPAVLGEPATWLVMALVVGVGWPFFMISTSAPLLQRWFSTLDHPQAADPYHLYAASNLGSFTALLSYPFLIEPNLGLTLQTSVWALGYLALLLSVGACAFVLTRRGAARAAEPRPTDTAAPPHAAIPLSARRRARWVLWAFVPSAMMLAVTSFITTDIAPIPLLWIPPLALYLLSFILVFARRRFPPERFFWLLLPPVLMGLVALPFIPDLELWAVTAVHFVGLATFCMVFHGFLASDRPATKDLTEFYLWMSLGGVLGGIFTAILAPLLFDSLLEYPILLVVAALAAPWKIYGNLGVRRAATVTIVAIAAVMLILHFQGNSLIVSSTPAALALVAIVAAGGVAVVRVVPRRLPALIAGLALVALVVHARPGDEVLYQERSFFAVHRVEVDPGGHFHFLYHGTTRHGAQALREGYRHLPLTYYYPTGPVDEIFSLINRRRSQHPVAVVGLGTGSMAAYAQEGRPMHLYEIDPAVVRIARDPELFTYLQDCGETCQVILGDGRLQLAASQETYELIVLDAYTSSAIPVHLLTREALELYLSRLRPEGIVAFHISNRHLDLGPPLLALAKELGLHARVRLDRVGESHDFYHLEANSSSWIIMARTPEAFRELTMDPSWFSSPPDPNLRVWTDDFANVLSTYRF